MDMEELYKKIKENPFGYLYLKRKRKFTMGDTDVEYGENEQSDFCVVFSPDCLDTQFPLTDTKVRIGRCKPIVTEYKNEYFSLSDQEIQKHMPQDTLKQVTDMLVLCLDTDEWYFL